MQGMHMELLGGVYRMYGMNSRMQARERQAKEK
jgi:hypothetical protein